MNTIIKKIKEEALENNVPIIQDESLEVINSIISKRRVNKILEVGTAVGYSSICFGQNPSVVQIDTIERNEQMYQKAISNITAIKMNEIINVHFGDALTIDISNFSNDFDLLFIDAAKAQSRKFFERYSSLLKPDGIIIVDNILFHGVKETDENISKNLKSLIKKINLFVEWLKQNEEYETIFFEGGDGLAISKRKC